MGVRTTIHGIDEGHVGARVTDCGSLIVSTLPIRRRDIVHPDHPGPDRRFYNARFADDTGATALNVNGATTNVSFKIKSDPHYYRAITEIITYFEDEQMSASNAEVRRFGSVAAAPGLTNGLLYRAYYSGITVDLLPDPAKAISDYVIFSSVTNIVDGVSTGVDILVSKLTLSQPIELVPEKSDYIEILVRDNLTALNTAWVVARGYEEDNV